MPSAGLKLARAVVQHRIGLGELVALSLFRHDVQELRAAQFLDVLQRWDQRIEIVAVNRADVVEAEFLEKRGRHDHALCVLLELAGEIEHGRRDAQHALDARARRRVETPPTSVARDGDSARRPAAKSTCRGRSGSRGAARRLPRPRCSFASRPCRRSLRRRRSRRASNGKTHIPSVAVSFCCSSV